jgi:hypothetical protein
MPVHARVNGGDSHAAGRARQHLKLAAIGYANARHGLDASAELAHAALGFLCQKAVEFVETLSGSSPKNRRTDPTHGDPEMLQLAAIAYASARHGIDADVGIAREGLALLCQASINYVESLPKEEPLKRSAQPHLQIGSGA